MMSSAGTPFITTHNTYYDFSGNNQAYNQFEISGDLLFAFCSSGNAIIGNFAYSKGVSRFHCYHGGREAVYSEMNHLHWNQSGIRNKARSVKRFLSLFLRSLFWPILAK
mmetsp:Transcript_10210/g.15435  ORF Transcript_10210/g.15435 Transcript_10210/m.15435 type:complete len:109 (-) Transcript_10210:1169-1495(-)